MGKLKKKIKNALATVGVATAMILPSADPVNAMPAPALEPSASIITFDPSQEQFFKDDSRVIIVNWHRQKGKDFVAAAKAVDHAIRTGQTWYIVSLTQRQADATFEKCKKVAEAFKKSFELVGNIESSEEKFLDHDKSIDEMFVYTSRTLTLPNGGKVVSLPGKNPDTLAGLTGNVIFTEFGLFPNGGYEHWRVVFPLSTRGFQVIIISTPRSKKTKFFEIFSNPETYSVHFCDIIQSVEQDGFILRDNKGNPCTIEEFKKLYGDDAGWQREYLCQFTGDLDALVTWAQLLASQEANPNFRLLRVTDGQGWDESFFRRELPHGRLEFGWDVARRDRDYSSFWCNLARRDGKKELQSLVLMSNTEFATMRHIIITGMESRMGSVGCGDATGLGMESNEALSARFRDSWEGVAFTEKTKSELGSLGRTMFGDDMVRLPSFAENKSPYKFIAADIYSIQCQPVGDPSDKRLRLAYSTNELEPKSHCDIGLSCLLAQRAGTLQGGRDVPLPPPLAIKPIGW